MSFLSFCPNLLKKTFPGSLLQIFPIFSAWVSSEILMQSWYRALCFTNLKVNFAFLEMLVRNEKKKKTSRPGKTKSFECLNWQKIEFLSAAKLKIRNSICMIENFSMGPLKICSIYMRFRITWGWAWSFLVRLSR